MIEFTLNGICLKMHTECPYFGQIISWYFDVLKIMGIAFLKHGKSFIRSFYRKAIMRAVWKQKQFNAHKTSFFYQIIPTGNRADKTEK